ncbi:hypothetical protein [Rhodovibrio salinarum]|uniref:Uncharacterized protein n=1 Tax=Rhodovibrio salinarum TaxID=1087 RepID=A0A934QG75_9PROT|nr:hypothetical protein [Rhodovibrio salinarum]MBK1696274.1 hypothetical protein [Rhodovibrio salinarum]
MDRPATASQQDQLLRLLDTRIALILASQPQGEQLRRHVLALRARLAVQQLDEGTLHKAASLIDSLAPRTTIDGEPMSQQRQAGGRQTGAKGAPAHWTHRAAPCVAGLAGLLVLFV